MSIDRPVLIDAYITALMICLSLFSALAFAEPCLRSATRPASAGACRHGFMGSFQVEGKKFGRLVLEARGKARH